MITAIAIDDEPLALAVINTFCQKVDFISLAKTFTETGAAFKYLEDNPVDLLFLDINMPAISGIDFYKKVGNNTMAIFTTAHSEYAVECFNLSAIDYLLKPFEFSRFHKAVEKAKEYSDFLSRKDNTSHQHLFLKVDYSIVKVALSEILYIEGLDNYLNIHFDNGKKLLVRMSMKGITEKLPAEEFIRVHRSFIVPFSKVTSVRNKVMHLDKKEIPIGTNYVDSVLGLFKDH
jgi:DNA-binding LytR/AlgR family response regulator